MSGFVGLQEPQRGWEPPAAKLLDEAAWQAWVARGGAQDRRRSEACAKAVKWSWSRRCSPPQDSGHKADSEPQASESEYARRPSKGHE